ncbi:MAG: ATP-grasp domain-containing protein, partial [Pseudomonadales bacterium]|nr:ATP-grasp domain-containing protein [Pseudomonadales bacterium]
RGGYDGKGQQRFKVTQPHALPDWKSEAIAEAAIPFDTEVSLVGARGRQGQCVFYRLTENLHQNGVLVLSLSQAERFNAVQAQAEDMLTRLMTHLDYVGVMAMECFLVGDRLLINEIAPRVHNSGHWTQDGASLCQFELHLRALLDWPLPQPAQTGTSLMINLLGLPHPLSCLQVAGARLYWYGKSLYPGRKMGHINMTHDDPAQLADWLQALPLPEDYQASRNWALQRLNAPEIKFTACSSALLSK